VGSGKERERRGVPLLVAGAVFVGIAFLADDVWALYAGGALLVIGWLQWVR
jgi:hypothetical protein